MEVPPKHIRALPTRNEMHHLVIKKYRTIARVRYNICIVQVAAVTQPKDSVIRT